MKSIFFAIHFVLSVLVTVIFLPKCYLLGLFNKRSQFLYACKVARNLSQNIFKSTRSAIQIQGLENIPQNETLLIVSNHQSNFDVVVLMGYLKIPFGVISKKELKKIPIFSTWMKLFHCVFMDRSTPRKSVEAIQESINNIKAGYSQLIFPEGTRSKSNTMGTFRAGSLKIALKTNTTILPVTVNDTYKIFEETNKIKSANVKLTVHKPIRLNQLDSNTTQNLSSYIENIIKSGLNQT